MIFANLGVGVDSPEFASVQRNIRSKFSTINHVHA